MAKLTLSMDPQIIVAAKAYAHRHHTSLSHLVARLLMDLESPPPDAFFAALHVTLLQEGFQEPAADSTPLRQRHVARKYL
jgi:menaquinone-dependent protoporphyrinogen IX oxidase